MVTLKKKIWLVNPAAMPPTFESRIQTLKRAKYLSEFGYDVTIIGGSYLHNTNINLIDDNRKFIEANYDGIKFIHIKGCSYKTSRLKRIYNLIEFHSRLILLSNKFIKPDIIEQVATVPFGNILYFLARKLKAKYIVNVVDLWPESFVALGIISKNNLLIKLAYLAEKWLYKKADIIIFSMEGGKDYIIEKKWDKANGGPINLQKVFYINNGVDLKEFNNNLSLYKFEDSDLGNNNIKKIIYIGSIRLANNLKELINAAEILKNYSNLKFLIYGDGEDRKALELFCKSRNLDNVIFKQKWIDPRYVPYVLSKSTINILNYKSGSFGKYGGSQSKLFLYLASGKPICSNLKMMYCLITQFNLGIAKEFNSDMEYAEAILTLVNLDQKSLKEIYKRTQEVVREFDYKVLTKKYIKIVQG